MQDEASADNDMEYTLTAAAYSKMAILTWCIAGWIYAAVTWHLFWLPGLLIFVPGILIASIVAMVFFVPFWRVMKTVDRDWCYARRKRVGLLLIATLLKVTGFIASIAAPVVYVKMLRGLME